MESELAQHLRSNSRENVSMIDRSESHIQVYRLEEFQRLSFGSMTD